MSKLFEDLFIFEMANSHQGSVEHGIDIIKEMGKIARKNNIKAAVKLQYRDLDSFIHPDFKDRTDVNHIPRFMSTPANDAAASSVMERQSGTYPTDRPPASSRYPNVAMPPCQTGTGVTRTPPSANGPSTACRVTWGR